MNEYGTGKSYQPCSEEPCQTEHHHEGYNEHCQEFLCLADCAWMECLKEKIKDHIKKQDGEHLDKLAEIITEANKKRWKNKMNKKTCCHEFEQKLCDLLLACKDK